MARISATCFALLCIVQAVFCQSISMADCATNCTLDLTSNLSSCTGIQCFCTDPELARSAFDCFQENCTMRQALTAQNMTALTCGFPDRNRGPVSSAVTFTSMALALSFVMMRIISFGFSRLWGWDDILTGLATILMVGNSISNPISRHFGYGRDVWRLPFNSTAQVLKIFYIGGILYALGIALTKLAFLCFYLKLFPSPGLRKVAYPLIVASFLFGASFTFLFIFQCSPISYAWTQWDGEAKGTCLNFDLGAVLHAIINIVLDLMIFAIPLTQLWHLNLSRKKKIQVMLMFCVGFFVTLVSILRLYSMVQLGDSTNPTWDYVPFGYWSDLEFNIGIACICMPSVRVVIRRYFPGCGMATTAAGTASGANGEMAARRVDLSTRDHHKSTKSFTQRVTADNSSDQVELCSYEGR